MSSRFLALKDVVLQAIPALKKDPSQRDYKERFYAWNYWRYFLCPLDVWDEGEDVEIYDGKSLAEGKIKDGFGEDFPDWFKKMGNKFGKETEDGSIFIGMAYSYVDYYYILRKPDGRKIYETCVAGLKLKEDLD